MKALFYQTVIARRRRHQRPFPRQTQIIDFAAAYKTHPCAALLITAAPDTLALFIGVRWSTSLEKI